MKSGHINFRRLIDLLLKANTFIIESLFHNLMLCVSLPLLHVMDMQRNCIMSHSIILLNPECNMGTLEILAEKQ